MASSVSAKQILQLLKKAHRPRVKIAPSTISGGGDGVFLVDSIDSPEPLCLYPGVFTPGLPSYAVFSDFEYLANETMPPSGMDFEENAYIINLAEGYFDGKALDRNLSDNPSASAHKINHGGRNANAKVVSINWADVLRERDEKGEGLLEYYQLPNSMRDDNTPWYFDASRDRIFRFNQNDTEGMPLYGAVAIPTKPIAEGAEVFLDYALRPPLPSWAKDWYQP